MACANSLNVRTHVSELREADRDTASEASGSGTSTSIPSAEDLQKLAFLLNISVEDVHQERFRIDRKRLEAMLVDNIEESQTAQAFFNRVMDETRTIINWPARLKIGARSKKDPHVRIAGRLSDVRLAREKIMQLLDTRSNRVTMKIDVSYTDHSHIIGKGGLTIKRVMEETGCHIHFPDSNRTSAVEKSNQVSIAGDMESVERARARVRALTPLIFSFELPIVSSSHPLPEINSPYIQQIQEQYKVQVMIRNRPKLHSSLLVVKGVQWEVQLTMEATNLLMKYMCGQLASQTSVHMNLEISAMHHPVVLGRGSEQLKVIMQGTNTQIMFPNSQTSVHMNLEISAMHHPVVLGRGSEQLKVIMRGTNTQVMFPDAEDPNIPALRKSCVTITGKIKDVYAARQQLVGSLPLVLIFDVPDEPTNRFDNDSVTALMQKYNVFISVRKKPKQGITSVVIKGIERCAGDIYEARRELLGNRESSVTAEIPESYNIPAISNTMPNFQPFNPFSPTHANINNMASPCTPFFQEMGYSPMYGPPTPGGYPAPLSPAVPPVLSWLVPSPQPASGQFHFPNPCYNQNSWNPMTSNVEMNSIPPMDMLQVPQPFITPTEGRPITLTQLLNSSSAGSSGYQSNFTGSTVSIDTQNISGGAEGVGTPSMSPISKTTQSPDTASDNDHTHQDSNGLASYLSEIGDRRAVGCEKKTLETLNKISPLSEYRKLQKEANQAMRENVGNGYRIPNPKWSGHYFSQTVPSPLSLPDSDSGNATTPQKPWNRSDLVRPNIIDTCASPEPGPSTVKPCRYQQLYELLHDIGLQKYIDLFKRHEVDISTFASLNEADLNELGVTAFGARRKMLLTIAELQKQASNFKGKTTKNRKLINSPPYDTTAFTQDKW